jgi:hypothetical protein
VAGLSCSFLTALVLSWLLSPGGSRCSDPLFLQYQARINERAKIDQRVDGWKDFLRTNPDNPCAGQVREMIKMLESSRTHRVEAGQAEKWEQRARGGVVEPGRDTFPAFLVLPDPVPRNQVRLHNELIWPADSASRRMEIDDPLLTQVLRVDVAPVSFLGLSLDLPLAAGAWGEEDFGYALGNITLGVRGIWGSFLEGDRRPFVLSGGVWWATGSSTWSPQSSKQVLDAAAFSSPCFFWYFRNHQSDYAVHAEGQLGLGRHVLGAALAYHVLSQQWPTSFQNPPDPITQMFRFDLAWQMEVLGWLFPSFELNGGVGFPGSSETTHLFLSPGVRLHTRHFSAAVGIRLPFLDVSGFSRMVMSVELGGQL